jgi:mono/diheme cytochrome c family protein
LRIPLDLRILIELRIPFALAALIFSWAGADTAWAYQPAVNFQLHCMGCHLADGSGEAGRVPSIRRSLVLFSTSSEGREYVIRVPGVAQSPLSDEETAALLNWMARNLSDLALPSDFTDYSAAEVKRLRAHPLAQVSVMRARLLRAAPDGSQAGIAAQR